MLLPLALWLGGCNLDVHEFPNNPEPEPEKPQVKIRVSFKNTDWENFTEVTWNLPSRGSRASVHTFRYSMNIYNDEKRSRAVNHTVVASTVIFTDEPYSIPDLTQDIDVELEPGKYSAIVWVDYSDADSPIGDLYYDTSDFTFIELLGDDHVGNNHHNESFRGATDFTVNADGTVTDLNSRAEVQVIPVVCERPLARFEFVTTDLEEFVSRFNIAPEGENPDPLPPGPAAPPAPNLDDYKIRMRYTSYMPTTYNANTDKPIDSKLGVSFEGKIQRISDHEASLGFDHVFVNHNDASVMVALDVIDSKTDEVIASCDPVTVPLRRNHHTVIRGQFLTATSGGSMGIDPGFDGDFNIRL